MIFIVWKNINSILINYKQLFLKFMETDNKNPL